MTHIALLIPAFNEEAGIALTAQVAREALQQELVHSVHVLDGGSTDRTAEIAGSFGVEVQHIPSVLTHLGPVLGKGDSLYRGTRTINADWYVFLDADLGNISVEHIRSLVQPIGTPGIHFIKGGFVRVDENGVPRDIPAGRVSELVGRPLLRRAALPLAGLKQPLSGQVAIRGSLAQKIEFVTGYGIEIAMLIDVFREVGVEGVVEADMGFINNRWKPVEALDDVRDQVLAGASLRVTTLPDFGIVTHEMVTNREN